MQELAVTEYVAEIMSCADTSREFMSYPVTLVASSLGSGLDAVPICQVRPVGWRKNGRLCVGHLQASQQGVEGASV